MICGGAQHQIWDSSSRTTSMISTTSRYIERIVREAIQIELHLHNMDWEDGFCLNKSLKPLLSSLNEHFSSSSSSFGSLAHAHCAFQGMDYPFRSPIRLVFWDVSAAPYSFTFLGLFHFLLLLLSLPSLIHRHTYDVFPVLSSLGMQPALLSEQSRYHLLCFHWLFLRPLIDYGHSSIGAVTVPFKPGVAYIRPEFPHVFSSFCCLLLA